MGTFYHGQGQSLRMALTVANLVMDIEQDGINTAYSLAFDRFIRSVETGTIIDTWTVSTACLIQSNPVISTHTATSMMSLVVRLCHDSISAT